MAQPRRQFNLPTGLMVVGAAVGGLLLVTALSGNRGGNGARLSVSPTVTVPGMDVELRGTGFPANAQAHITIGGIPRAPLDTDQNGAFVRNRMVPADLRPGTTQVVATVQTESGDISASANLQILSENPLPLNIVMFNWSQIDQFLDEWSGFVLPGDDVQLLSGGNFRRIDVREVNEQAAALKEKFPWISVQLNTTGLNDVIDAANGLDPDLIDVILATWEPNKGPDFPDGIHDRGNEAQLRQVTRDFYARYQDEVKPKGFQFWGYCSGVWTPDRHAFGLIDYRDILDFCDGLTVETQSSCKNDPTNQHGQNCANGSTRFECAVDYLIDLYESEEVAGEKPLYTQVTVDTDAINGCSADCCFDCSVYGWQQQPLVKKMTMWWALNQKPQAERYLELRQGLLQEQENMLRAYSVRR